MRGKVIQNARMKLINNIFYLGYSFSWGLQSLLVRAEVFTLKNL